MSGVEFKSIVKQRERDRPVTSKSLAIAILSTGACGGRIAEEIPKEWIGMITSFGYTEGSRYLPRVHVTLGIVTASPGR